MKVPVDGRTATPALLEGRIRIAAYCRSAVDPATDGDNTIDAQFKRIRKYGAEYGLHVCTLYIDEGYSGLTPLDSRPGGVRMLEDAHFGRYDLLLVTDLNRLSRNIAYLETTMAKLDLAGVPCRTIDDNFGSKEHSLLALLQED